MARYVLYRCTTFNKADDKHNSSVIYNYEYIDDIQDSDVGKEGR